MSNQSPQSPTTGRRADPDRVTVALAILLEQVARNIYPERAPTAMHPGQWAALRYFARANREARTVAGLARFLGITAGPASRAVSALVRKGLVSDQQDSADRRIRRIQVTPAGEELLQSDPLMDAARILETLQPDEQRVLGECLAALQTRMGERSKDEPLDPFLVVGA
jgi:DNA-binding MarR family transcriptional regulator